MEYIFGADVGGSSTKLGVFDREGKLIAERTVPTVTSGGGERIIPDIARAVKSLSGELEPGAKILGMGMAVPGPVEAGGMVNGCVNLGWGRKDAAGEMAVLTDFPVFLLNDANAAALGEVWQGAARNCGGGAFMVTLGTGVGGAFIFGEQVVNGANGAGGEIGHMTVNPREIEQCTCGRRGCLEQYVSTRGMVRTAKEQMGLHPESTLLSCDELSGKIIFEQALAGDEAAIKTVRLTADILGQALACAAAICDPEVFIIGGGLSGGGDYYLEQIVESYRRSVMYPCRETKFVIASLGHQAGMYGAARFAMGFLKGV
ncbi:MAG: ROK family protein [Eubacteriaceae bacterium]|nr:ROK family protein [Eubacteriaceae bacterium]